jgi:hypothetical protein
MSKFLNKLRILIVGVVVLSSIPLTIAYFGGIEPKHDFMVILHVISGILFILVAIPITVKENNN